MKAKARAHTKRTKKGPAQRVGSGRLVSRAYTWKFKNWVSGGNWVLCKFCESTKEALLLRGKPTDDARIVRVNLIPG